MDNNSDINLLSLEADSSSFSTKDLRRMVGNFTHLIEIVIPKDILLHVKVKVREGSQAIDLVTNRQANINFESPYQYIDDFINEKNSLSEKSTVKAAKYIKSLCEIKSKISLFTNSKKVRKINFDETLSKVINNAYLCNGYETIEMGIIEGIIHSISDNEIEQYNQIKIKERVSNKIIPCIIKDQALIQKIINKNFWQKLVVITGGIYYSRKGEYKKVDVQQIEDYRESFNL